MSNLVPITILTILVSAFFAFSLSIGYMIRRKSERAGIVFATAGSITGAVLAINYFEEIPLILIGASFAFFVGAFLFAAFEFARQDDTPNASNV